MILTQEYSRVASDYGSDNRAWLVSPQGVVIPCGEGEHEKYIKEHPDEFDGHDIDYMMEEGWVRVGVFQGVQFYAECLDQFNTTTLAIVQELAKQTQIPYQTVETNVFDRAFKQFDREEFQFKTLKDVNRR